MTPNPSALNKSHPLARGLVGLWLPGYGGFTGYRLRGLAGLAHNGVITGTRWDPQSSPGLYGSLNFVDSAGEKVDFGDDADFKPRSGDFSLVVVAYTGQRNVADSAGGILGWQSTANSWFDLNVQSNGAAQFRLDDNSTRLNLNGVTVIDDSQKWWTVGVTRAAGSDWRLLLNGVLETANGSDPLGDINPTGTTFAMGLNAQSNAFGSAASGDAQRIAAVLIWKDRALSDAEHFDVHCLSRYGFRGLINPVYEVSIAPPATGGGSSVAADAGSYALTGSAASLLKGSKTPADAGSYSVTGSAATLLKGYTLSAEAGSYNVSGQAASLTKQWAVSAQAGSYALTGSAASLEKGWNLAAQAGSYTLTGSDATLTDSGAGATLTADPGSYSVTGTASTLTKQWAVAANAGSYSLAGTDAALSRNITVSATAGAYNLTGTTASLTKQWSLSATAGAYTLTGTAATLTDSGAETFDRIIVTNVQITLPSANSVAISLPSANSVQLVE